VRTLVESGVPNHKTAQVSGHKDPNSISHYDTKALSVREHKEYSRLLDRLPEDRDPNLLSTATYSAMSLQGQNRTAVTHTVTQMTDTMSQSTAVTHTRMTETMPQNSMLSNLIGGTGGGVTNFNNCTFNFNVPTRDIDKPQFDLRFSLSPEERPKSKSGRQWKRIKAIPSDSSSEGSQ
jgi:hypothetical protein